MTVCKTRRTVKLIIGLALVILGTLHLFGELLGINPWRFWPLLVILPGLLFFVTMVLDGQTAGWLAIPGSMLVTIGLILLYQSLTDHWESWAYAWALIFPTAIGIGLAIQGKWNGEEYAFESGLSLVKTGFTVFLAAGIFFELVLNISGLRDDRIGAFAWPALLVGLGLYLLVGRGELWYDFHLPPPRLPGRNDAAEIVDPGTAGGKG
ncbi:MAG: hypothetical protein ACM3ZC_10975 [Bacteroidota bacterium]